MSEIADDLISVTKKLKADILELERRIELYPHDNGLNPIDHQIYKSKLKASHDSLRMRTNLLATMLETDSSDILSMVKTHS